MYLVVRHYDEVDPEYAKQSLERNRNTLVPLLSQQPGFVAYYTLEGEDGTVVSIGVYDSKEEAERSTQIAADWVKQNTTQFVKKAPRVTQGEVLVYQGPGAPDLATRNRVQSGRVRPKPGGGRRYENLSEKIGGPMIDFSQPCDVLVVGGGNAAICAAIMAARGGATVTLLESAPQHFRGGNSRHTRDIRYKHAGATTYVTGAYHEDEFWDDVMRVTGGETTEHLLHQVIRESEDLGDWMMEQGVRWQMPLRGTLHLARTNLFMLGGGKAMMNAYYDTCHKLGVQVAYDTEVRELKMREGHFESAVVVNNGVSHEVRAKAVVIASGGFEANVPWLKEYWGDAADNFIIRGTPYNQGKMLRELLEHGAKSIGNERECHAVALDARSPKFDGGIITRLDSVPFGLVVNSSVERFYDEGEDFWPKRYAIWGGLIARQEDQIAYSITDAKAIGKFMPSVFPPIEASSVQELGGKLGIDADKLVATVDEFNRACQPGHFDPGELDDCHTEGLTPPKSHWAQPINEPPFWGYPLRCGITFTYLGVAVDERAQLIMHDDRPSANVFAAGEVMAGNILGRGYLAGFGLTIGHVLAGSPAGRQRGMSAVKLEVNLTDEVARQMVICNACRYCEGFCAVFPAMELRRTFIARDVTYLSNLCFDCRACYYACQYAPPHEFAINVPKIFSELRTETYRQYSWPGVLSKLFRRNGLAVGLISAVCVALSLALVMAFTGRGALFARHVGDGAFYRVVPYLAMVLPATAIAIYAAIVFAIGTVRFWRDTESSFGNLVDFSAFVKASQDAFGLRYLSNGGYGCNYPNSAFSQSRRWFHHLVFYGFLFDFASTTVAAVYDHFLHWAAPYPLLSWPVVLGTIGGVMLLIGTVGLLYLKWQSDRDPTDSSMAKMDVAFLVMLFLTSLTGLLLLVLRDSTAMGLLLTVHLGVVAALFLTMPYGKFAHLFYRYAALIRNSVEQARVEAAGAHH